MKFLIFLLPLLFYCGKESAENVKPSGTESLFSHDCEETRACQSKERKTVLGSLDECLEDLKASYAKMGTEDRKGYETYTGACYAKKACEFTACISVEIAKFYNK